MSVPSWVTALALGQWYQIPGTNLSSVSPSPQPPGSPTNKIDAWTSLVVDPRSSKLYSVAGGGHVDYSGNEVDGLDLSVEVPSWSQLLAPTPAAQVVASASFYADNHPTSRHHYYGLMYVGQGDLFVLLAGSRWGDGGVPQAMASYNITANTYNGPGTHPNVTGNWNAQVGTMTVDPSTGNIYGVANNTASRWTQSNNTLADLNPSGPSPYGYYTSAAFDSTRGRAFFLGGGNADHHVLNVAGNTFSLATITGAAAGNVMDPGQAMVYVPALDAYLVRGAGAGGAVYQINASTFAATVFTTSGGGSILATLNGPFNKFLYVPALGGFVYIPTYTGNVWFLRTNLVTNAAGNLVGNVDSSLIDRHTLSKNGVYAFSGLNNTSGTPAYIAPVMQTYGTALFRYSLNITVGGDYTIAVTRDGGLTFNTQSNVTINGNATKDFAALNTIQVGPGRTFTHPNQVVGSAPAGAVIAIDAGTYTNVQGVWTQNSLTFRGIGGNAHLRAINPISNQKATWVTQGSDNRVENIEFSDAAVPDFNGCGIRVEGVDLAVSCCYFHDNEGGMLGNDNNNNILVEYSKFDTEGNCNDPAHCSHHVYFGHNARTTIQFCEFLNAFDGHCIKARSLENRILYNKVMDQITGQSSYLVDLPNGGLSYLVGNLIQKGVNSQNSGAAVIYGEEGLTNADTHLYVINNTFVNDLGNTLATYIQVQAGANNAVIENNLFVSATNRTIATGPNTQTTNLQTATPNFFDQANFDYRPKVNTPGIGGGTAPGTAGSFNLAPVFQYVPDVGQQDRPTDAAIDIGAYEYSALMPITSQGAVALTGLAPVLKNNNIENPPTGSFAFTGNAGFLNGSLGQTPATGALAFVATKPSLNFTGVQFPLTGAASFAGIAPTTKQGTVISPQSGTLSASTTAPAVASVTFRLVGGAALLLTQQPAILGGPGAIAVNQGQAVFGGAGPTLTFINLIVPPAGAMVASGTQASVIVKPPTSIEVPTGGLDLQGASPDIFIPLAARLSFTTFAPVVLSSKNRRPTLSGVMALEGNQPVVVSTHSKPRKGPRAILHLLPMLREWF